MWFPHVILKKGYDETQALIVLAFWIVILGVRTLRTPEAVFLQAAGEFRALARVSMWSSVTSLTVTLALLLVAGPICVARRPHRGRSGDDGQHLLAHAQMETRPCLKSSSRSPLSAARKVWRGCWTRLRELETNANVRVLVADNDAEQHQGFDLCKQMRAQLPLAARCHHRARSAASRRCAMRSWRTRWTITRCNSSPCWTTTNGPRRNG